MKSIHSNGETPSAPLVPLLLLLGTTCHGAILRGADPRAMDHSSYVYEEEAVSFTPPSYNHSVVNAFWAKTWLNPLPPMSQNPYNISGFNTTWNDSVCALKYPVNQAGEEDRNKYYLYNYPTPEAAKQDNAYVTHLHPCGYCSSTKDLAIYMNYTDLTNPGKQKNSCIV